VRTAPRLVLLLLAASVLGCDWRAPLDWEVVDVSVEPLTLTAGSRETWRIDITVDPPHSGQEPERLWVEMLNADGSALTGAPAWGSAYTAFWSFVWDNGTLGDLTADDFVYTHEGLHPFDVDTPPGQYLLRVCRFVACEPSDAFELPLEILAP